MVNYHGFMDFCIVNAYQPNIVISFFLSGAPIVLCLAYKISFKLVPESFDMTHLDFENLLVLWYNKIPLAHLVNPLL